MMPKRDLWPLPAAPLLPLSQVTLDSIQATAISAQLKHKDRAMHNDDLTVAERLAALGEEFGEVCKELTYDHNTTGDTDALVKELLQLGYLATAWAQWLDEHKGSLRT